MFRISGYRTNTLFLFIYLSLTINLVLGIPIQVRYNRIEIADVPPPNKNDTYFEYSSNLSYIVVLLYNPYLIRMSTIKNMNIGKRFKLARISKDISVKEMAEVLNVTPATIIYIEKKDSMTPLIGYLIYLRKQGVDLNLLF